VKSTIGLTILLMVLLGGMVITGCDSGDRQGTILPARQQQAPPDQPINIPPGKAGSQSVISNEELEKAAAAHVAIAEIQYRLQQALQDTKVPDQKQKLQDSANEKMIEAVQNTGLSFEKYNEIMEVVVRNRALSQEFQTIVQRVQ
jgi:hypothetical protein